MKANPLPLKNSSNSRSGYTLVEVLVTMVTMVLVVSAVMAAHIYGLKMVQFVKPKLGASDEARNAIALITDEIRSARVLKIGSVQRVGGTNVFTEVSPFTQQAGSALQLYPSTNYNQYILYYWDISDKKLKRTVDGTTSTYIVANSVSNQMIFTAEDFAGNVLSNNFNNRVLGMTLQFYQIQYPITAVGPGNYYDFYQLRAKITRRTLL